MPGQELSPPKRTAPYAVIGLGMAAVSAASIFISLARAEGVPALVIAALRMALAAGVAAPLALVRARRELRAAPWKDRLLAVSSGVLLALHFGFWISSFDYTSVMSSVVFVSTNPLFVGLASWILLGERLGGGAILGVAVGAVGGALVGLGDLSRSGMTSIRGDGLSLLGALSVSGYLLIGRRLRGRMSLALYVGIAYTVAAVCLLSLLLILGTPLGGYSIRGYLWVALLAVGPQLLGHTSYNWALKYLSATFVTVTLLVEPIGATLLAIPILGQMPRVMGLIGGLVILAGIFLTARAEATTELV